MKLPYENCSPQTKNKETFLSPEMRVKTDKNLYKQNLLNNKNLPLVSLFLLFYNCHLFNLVYKHLGFATSLSLHFPMELPITCENLYNFLLLIYLMSGHAKKPRRVDAKLCLFYTYKKGSVSALFFFCTKYSVSALCIASRQLISN